MKQTMQTTNLPKTNGQPKKLMIIIPVIIILVLAGAGYFWLINKNKTSQGPTWTSNQPETSEATEEKDNFPDNFYSYLGKVKIIEDDKIVILAEASKNYLKKDTEITAVVNEETEYIKVTIPKRPELDESGQPKTNFIRNNIEKAEIKAGDEIIVISFENVKNKNEILARKIELRQVR